MLGKCPNCGDDIKRFLINNRIVVGCLFCIQKKHNPLINLERCPQCKTHYCKLIDLCNCGPVNSEQNEHVVDEGMDYDY